MSLFDCCCVASVVPVWNLKLLSGALFGTLNSIFFKIKLRDDFFSLLPAKSCKHSVVVRTGELFGLIEVVGLEVLDKPFEEARLLDDPEWTESICGEFGTFLKPSFSRSKCLEQFELVVYESIIIFIFDS